MRTAILTSSLILFFGLAARGSGPAPKTRFIGGSIVSDGQSDGSKAVRGVWRGIDAPNVQYYRTPDSYPLLVPSQSNP